MTRNCLEFVINKIKTSVKPRDEHTKIDHSHLTTDELSMLGVSVFYLSTIFLSEVKSAGLDEASKIYEIENLTDVHEYGVIRRKGFGVSCPIDHRDNAAYVHCLTDVDHVGRSTIMISYAWAYTIGDIVDTLVGYCERNKLDLKRTYIWICCLCVNQHRVVESQEKGDFVPFEKFERIFHDRVTAIGNILAMMAPWPMPTCLTRVWCVFELFTASNNDGEVTIVMPPRERKDFINGMKSGNGLDQVNKLFKTLGSIKVQNAKSSEPSDLKNILSMIENGPGYEDFNATVSGLIRKWVIGVLLSEVETAEQSLTDDKAISDHAALLNNVGELFYRIGEYDLALTASQDSLKYNETIYGREHECCARSLDIIGKLNYRTGDLEEGLEAHREALAIQENKLGKEHIDTAMSLNGIANILRAQGKLDQALKIYEEVLIHRQTVLGREHIDTASTLNNIAALLYDQDEFEESLKMFKEVLAIEDKVLGRHHASTAQSFFNIARVLHKQSEFEGAVEMFQQALEIFEKVLGSNHVSSKITRFGIKKATEALKNQVA